MLQGITRNGHILLKSNRCNFKLPRTYLPTKYVTAASISVPHLETEQEHQRNTSDQKSDIYIVCNHGLAATDLGGHSEAEILNRYSLCGQCNILGYNGTHDYTSGKPEQYQNSIGEVGSSLDIRSSNFGRRHNSSWFPRAQNNQRLLHEKFSITSNYFHKGSLWRYAPFSTSPADANWIVIRSFHSSRKLMKEESKAEQSVKALKSVVDKKEAEKRSVAPEQEPIAAVQTDEKKDVAEAPAPKKTIGQRIVAELKHYYNGFKLLFIDVRVCTKLLWMVLNGKSLSRRERRQLVRTTADLFRLVPFLVFIIVPFMEFLLPVALKLFPGMLPSTFKEEDKEKEKFRKNLKLKLEMAKFLQDTIEETALQRKGAKGGDKAGEFAEFLNKIRTTGHGTTNEEIMKYCKLFEDEITLDNLSHNQLRALCNLVEIPTMGTSNFLRFQLRLKLRQLEADDKMIQKEGLNSLATWELQEAARARGMRAMGVPADRLKLQLQQWLDLHLDHEIPTSLLLLSRTLYMPESVPAEEQLKATISQLPETTAGEAKVKISEVAGDRIDNKTKLEIIKQEQEAIRMEQEEREREEQLTEEVQKKKEAKVEPSPAAVIDEVGQPPAEPTVIIDQAPEIKTSPEEILKDKAEEITVKEEEVISSKDFEAIEEVLEAAAIEKNIPVGEEELKNLKEDVTEYKEALEDLKQVVVSSGSEELIESKAAQRLSRRVDSMVSQLENVMSNISKDKAALIEDIEVKEVKMKRSMKLKEDAELREEVQEQIDKGKAHVISMNEMILAMRRLQKVPDEDKLQKIAQVLDEDHDGVIDVNDALRVIELLGQENIKLGADQVGTIMSLLRREDVMEQEEKEQKIKDKLDKNTTDFVSPEEIMYDKACTDSPRKEETKATKEREQQ